METLVAETLDGKAILLPMDKLETRPHPDAKWDAEADDWAHSKEVARYADVAMWDAQKHTDPQKPRVTVSMVTPDPLGVMAMVNGQYTGKVYNRPSEVTDEERADAWHAATVSLLSEAPLEWIQLSLSFENVSRAFTHQLVRTRMAGYAQESMRFAVKTDLADAVKLPPSLEGTRASALTDADYRAAGLDPEVNRTEAEGWRNLWDEAVDGIASSYAALVNNGMPAEDARGLLPTNVLTRVHMHTDMGTLLKLAGKRLCTQAQHEWRAVFAQVVQALREYVPEDHPDRWQYELMAGRFRPVCFAAGYCPVNSAADRHCSIRPQVQKFAELGIAPRYWEDEETVSWVTKGEEHAIRPEQWLADPEAARVRPS